MRIQRCFTSPCILFVNSTISLSPCPSAFRLEVSLHVFIELIAWNNETIIEEIQRALEDMGGRYGRFLLCWSILQESIMTTRTCCSSHAPPGPDGTLCVCVLYMCVCVGVGVGVCVGSPDRLGEGGDAWRVNMSCSSFFLYWIYKNFWFKLCKLLQK